MTAITSLWSVPGRTCNRTNRRETPRCVGVGMTRRKHVSEQGRTMTRWQRDRGLTTLTGEYDPNTFLQGGWQPMHITRQNENFLPLSLLKTEVRHGSETEPLDDLTEYQKLSLGGCTQFSRFTHRFGHFLGKIEKSLVVKLFLEHC